MSQENVEIVRRAYELWNGDEVEPFLALVHPDLVYTTSGVFPGFAPEYCGREGMLRFRETMLEAWETFRIVPTDLTANGEWVIAAVRFLGKGQTSGVEVDFDFHHVLHLRDGRLDRLVSAPGRAEALEAAGLSE